MTTLRRYPEKPGREASRQIARELFSPSSVGSKIMQFLMFKSVKLAFPLKVRKILSRISPRESRRNFRTEQDDKFSQNIFTEIGWTLSIVQASTLDLGAKSPAWTRRRALSCETNDNRIFEANWTRSERLTASARDKSDARLNCRVLSGNDLCQEVHVRRAANVALLSN